MSETTTSPADEATRPIASVLSAQGVGRTFHQGEVAIDVLHDVDLVLAPGERVAIVGRSGSGKSTLLHILAGLDSADSGAVLVGNVSMTDANANARARLRGAHMGFVYQNHHLLPEFTALENVAMPIRINGGSRSQAEQEAAELLAAVGLADRVQHLPSALSGGERQRVAVARALAGHPEVVLADEPTGKLDSENAQQVMNLVSTLSRDRNTAFLVVTHDISMLGSFDRVLQLIDGRLSDYVS